MSSSKLAPGQAATIDLLPAEELLRDLLLECRQQLATPDLEIWINGGGVRDRLLGIPCADLDIALSTMTGMQFGNLLTKFLKQDEGSYRQRALGLGIDFNELNGFHKTKKNLDKPKKLETAVGRIFGLGDLDLVNLRKEVYDDDCRTPETEFGTAEEDAFRRDVTTECLVLRPAKPKGCRLYSQRPGRSVCWHNADTTRAKADLSRRSLACASSHPHRK